MNSYSFNLNIRRFSNYTRQLYNYSEYYNSFNPLRMLFFRTLFLTKFKEFRSLFIMNTNNLKDNIDEAKTNFSLYSQAESLPHYKKREKGGEDCHYIDENIIVVADGVGGWNHYGINPGEYSKKICESIANQFKGYEKIDENTAKNMIIKAKEEVLLDGST